MRPTDEDLVSAARQARERAYAPYSHFSVGAAVEGDDGRIYTGCNVENSSYGLTSCAERNAVFAAVAAGCRKIQSVAVAADEDYTLPCGACRQVLAEFSAEYIILTAKNGQYRVVKATELFPQPFSLQEDEDERTI